MHHLTERMYPGIGAPGANGTGRAAQKLRERALEMILHATAAGLTLPAAVGRAAVTQTQRDPGPGLWTR